MLIRKFPSSGRSFFSCLLFLTGLLTFSARAQMDRYYKPVRNFSSVDHRANNQSLCALRDNRGVLYFGEALGMKVFDGNNWKVIGSMGRVYSGAFDSENTLFTGTESDFGFQRPDGKGNLRFQSLAPKNMPADVGVFWYTICTPGKVYFVSASVIYVYDYKSVSAILPQNRFHKAFYCNGHFFVKEFDSGLFCLVGNNFVPVKGSDIFQNARVDAMMPYSGDTIFLASRELGLMYFKFNPNAGDTSATFIPITSEVNDILIREELNSGIRLPGNRFALGTKKAGVLIVDGRGKLLSTFNTSNGLINNMVWGLTQDSQNGLWIALENGISRVEFESPFQPVNPEAGYSGNIESINKLGRYIFLGTTTGLHCGLETDLKFNRIGRISEPCWSIEPITTSAGKSLLVASRSGLYMVDANNQVQILAAGNYGCAKQLTKQPNIIVVGTPNTIDFFRIVGEKPVLSYRINNIDGEKQSIEQDRFGNLWIGTRDHGVLFIDGAGLGVTRHHNFVWLDDANGLPSVGENKVFSLFDKIFVSGFDGIFELAGYHGRLKIGEIARLKFQEADWLTADFFRDKKMDDTRQVWALSQDQEGRVHLSTRFKNNFEVILASPQRAGKFVWEANTYRVLPNDQVRAIFHDNQGISYLGGAEFLYRFERNKKIDVNTPAECLVRFLVTGEDTLYYGDGIANKDNSALDIEPIEYNRDFVFFFSSTFYSSNLLSQFSTFLEGEDKNWSAWSENATRSFSRLWPGTYTLKVKARNPYGVTGKVAEFRFRIIPPWYLTWWAFVLFFIAVVFILIAIVKIYTIGLNRIIRSQTVEIIEQKNLIENKNKEITDSIWYAKRIQDAIMPAGDYFSGLFPRSFIILRPKDIVSGDFYWANERGNEKILVAADCTGHGVPGAFMSMMGHDYLNEIIIDKRVTSPDEILNLLRAGIIKALKQRGEEGGSKDGMDVSLIRFNETEGTIDFAGANNPIYIIRSASFSAPDGFHFQSKSGSFILYEFKGDKFPVGIHYGTLAPFTSKTIRVLPGDRIYMFSDGFADQFGGPHGKKLKNIQFKNFLLETAQLNISSQSDFLIKQFDRWKGSLEQVDDVLVLGIEI